MDDLYLKQLTAVELTDIKSYMGFDASELCESKLIYPLVMKQAYVIVYLYMICM